MSLAWFQLCPLHGWSIVQLIFQFSLIEDHNYHIQIQAPTIPFDLTVRQLFLFLCLSFSEEKLLTKENFSSTNHVNYKFRFKWNEEDLPTVQFSSKKLLDRGFKFKYTMEEMFDQAIQKCREMKLIPLSTKEEPKEQSRNGSIKPTSISVWSSIPSKNLLLYL